MNNRIFSLLVLSLFIINCSDDDPDVNSIAPEYQVYSALIEQMYQPEAGDLIVIDAAANSFVIVGDDPEQKNFFLSQMPEVPGSLYDLFVASIDSSYSLEEHFDLEVSYKVFTEQDRMDSFGSINWNWEQFYEEYPKAQGLIQLSSVAFTDDTTQALVHVWHQVGWLAGSGYLVYLTYEDDQWTISDSELSGVSRR